MLHNLVMSPIVLSEVDVKGKKQFTRVQFTKLETLVSMQNLKWSDYNLEFGVTKANFISDVKIRFKNRK